MLEHERQQELVKMQTGPPPPRGPAPPPRGPDPPPRPPGMPMTPLGAMRGPSPPRLHTQA